MSKKILLSLAALILGSYTFAAENDLIVNRSPSASPSAFSIKMMSYGQMQGNLPGVGICWRGDRGINGFEFDLSASRKVERKEVIEMSHARTQKSTLNQAKVALSHLFYLANTPVRPYLGLGAAYIRDNVNLDGVTTGNFWTKLSHGTNEYAVPLFAGLQSAHGFLDAGINLMRPRILKGVDTGGVKVNGKRYALSYKDIVPTVRLGFQF